MQLKAPKTDPRNIQIEMGEMAEYPAAQSCIRHRMYGPKLAGLLLCNAIAAAGH